MNFLTLQNLLDELYEAAKPHPLGASLPVKVTYETPITVKGDLKGCGSTQIDISGCIYNLKGEPETKDFSDTDYFVISVRLEFLK